MQHLGKGYINIQELQILFCSYLQAVNITERRIAGRWDRRLETMWWNKETEKFRPKIRQRKISPSNLVEKQIEVEGQVLRVSLAINRRSKEKKKRNAAENKSWQDDGLDDLMHFPSLTSMTL